MFIVIFLHTFFTRNDCRIIMNVVIIIFERFILRNYGILYFCSNSIFSTFRLILIFAFMNVGLILLSFGQGFYHKYTINVAYLMTVVGTTFIVFSYDAVGAKNRTHHILDEEQMHKVLSYYRGISLPQLRTIRKHY